MNHHNKRRLYVRGHDSCGSCSLVLVSRESPLSNHVFLAMASYRLLSGHNRKLQETNVLFVQFVGLTDHHRIQPLKNSCGILVRSRRIAACRRLKLTRTGVEPPARLPECLLILILSLLPGRPTFSVSSALLSRRRAWLNFVLRGKYIVGVASG